MAVLDVTDELDKEEGTAFTPDDLLFSSYDDGDVFAYDDTTNRNFKTMFERDGKANTIEQVLTLPVRAASRGIKRGMAEKKVHDFVENVLLAPPANGGMSVPIGTIIAQMCQAFVYKKTFFERCWTEKDGKNVYDKLAWRPPGTCRVDRDKDHGAFRGFRQMPIRPEDTEEIKFKVIRSFVYIHGQHRNPLEGTSDLDIAYWCFQTKQKIRFLWYSFLEGQSLPKTIVRARTEGEAIKGAKKIVKLRQGGVVGMTDQVTTDILESSGKGGAQFKEALQWLDSEASNSVLAGFTDLGSTAASGTGSFALSKDQTDFFLMNEQAKAREMEDSLNAYVIPDLVFANFGPGTTIPTFEFGPIAEDDAEQSISLLQAIGVTKSPVFPEEFYNELIERVAGFLGLNTQVVREGLDRVRKEAEAQAAAATDNPVAPPVAGLRAVVNKSTDAVVGRMITDNTGRGPDVRAS